MNGNKQTITLTDKQPEERRPTGRPRTRTYLFDGTRSRKQRKFLMAYAIYGQIRKAAEVAGIDFRAHYWWLKNDPDYAERFEMARQVSLDLAEDEIHRRGIEGYDKPLHYKGRLTGDTIKEYSDTLALGFLKANREKYREGGVVPIGPSKINLTVMVNSPIGQQSESPPVEEIELDRGESKE